MKKLGYILCLFLFLGLSSNLTAGGIEARKFDEKKLESFRDAYQYDRKIRPPKKDSKHNNNTNNNNNRNTTPRNSNRGNNWGDGGSASVEGGNTLIYILFAVAIIGVALVILSSKSGGLTWVRSNNSTSLVNEEEQIIDIHKMDIDSIAQKAKSQGEFRRAIRMMYLNLLKKLSTKKVIEWEENKTNRDYFYEIKNKDIRQKFEQTTLMYEYAWYGDVEIHEDQFNIVETSFNNLMKKIG